MLRQAGVLVLIALCFSGSTKSPASAAAATPVTSIRDGMFFLEANDTVLPGVRAFDLTGWSLVYTPVSASTYTVARVALEYVEPTGAPVTMPEYGQPAARGLTSPITVFGHAVSTIYYTQYNAIYLSSPADDAADLYYYDAIEAMRQSAGVFSPLLFTSESVGQVTDASLYINETAGGLVLTWRNPDDEFFGYDVQAAVRPDGTIVFSYKHVFGIEWGTPVLSPGRNPSPAQRVLVGVDDPAGDVPARTDGLAPMIDITRVDIVRIDETDLLMARIKLSAAPVPSQFAGQTLRYALSSNGTAFRSGFLNVLPDGSTLVLAPGRTWARANNVAGAVNGDTIEIYFKQPDASLAGTNLIVQASVGSSTGDTSTVPFQLDTPQHPTVVDLSAAAGSAYRVPIIEPFTLGLLSVAEVWNQIKQVHGLSDSDVEAVAVYETFFSEILFGAGGYAVAGNAHVDGTGMAANSTLTPKTPTRIEVNHYRAAGNASEEGTGGVFLHEFGHRWLFGPKLKVNGVTSTLLSPDGGHAPDYVHMPAPYRVWRDNESSMMGGARWTLNNDGTFHKYWSEGGYSLIELYLMGLIDASEVPPFFYLTNLQYLGDDNFTADSHPVTVNDIIAANGARNPSYATSPKTLPVAIVLVTRPGESGAAEALARMKTIRATIRDAFTRATNGRGALALAWPAGFATDVAAEAVASTSVTVRFAATSGYTYEVARVSAGGIVTTVGTTTTGQLTDNTAAASTAYLYKVRTIAPAVTSYSTGDVATTFTFTDPTITPGITAPKAVHLTQLRTAVNAVRSLAGLLPYPSADPALTANVTPIKAAHISELRTALDEALVALGVPPATYSYSAVAGSPIRAIDITELRNAVK